MISSAARERLDQYMEARRIELGMRWRDVAAAAGITYETLRAARKGSANIPPLTQAGIERGLQWTRGSVAAVLEGGEPTPLGSGPEGYELAEAHSEVVQASVAEFVRIFRVIEAHYGKDRDGASRWLANALEAREEHVKRQTIARRDVS